MQKRLIKITIVLLIGILPEILMAQEAYEFDLGKNKNGTIKKTVNHSEDIQLIITNKLITDETSYDISIVREFQMNEVLELEVKKDKDSELKSDGCDILTEHITAIKEAKKEEKVAQFVIALEKELQELRQPDPDDKFKNCGDQQILLAKKTIEDTRESRKIDQLKPNEQVVITISRQEDGNRIEWKHILQTQKRGQWLTTYGFTYVASILKKEEPFFAKQVDSAFSITPLERRSRLNFVPSVFFTWFPYKDVNKAWSKSITAGVGYDLEAPTAFLGASFLYHHNIAISVGLAAHQQDFLNGRYSPGDIINDNLTEDQLNEKLYVFNPYISINFRLGASPFKGPQQDANTDEQ